MITINELSVTVGGNIVKNNDKDGNTILRVSQEQAQSLYDQLGPVLDFFASQTKPVVAPSNGTPAEAIGGKSPEPVKAGS